MERGSPHRQPPSPSRTNNKLRLCAYVSPEDVSSSRISLPAINQIQIAGAQKSHSKNAFETVFGPEHNQNDISTSVLPELLHTLFNGNDCSFVAFGGKSRGKESLLYGEGPGEPGIVQTSVESMFTMMDEFKSKRSDFRFQLRLSALLYSQRENSLTDLLSPFNSDPRRRAVRIAEDARAGSIDIENESAIKVESAEQAQFYLNTVIDHRIVEDEETYRTNHLFLFFSLYSYRTNGTELEGGRRRFCVADLGIGERNSQKGELTMPVLGSILLALYQGQKHLSARENTLSLLLRCALCSSRLSTLVCSFGSKTDDNENIVQLASKLARVKRTRAQKITDGSTVSGGRRSEIESGSEVSAAETVIYVGPRPLHRSPKMPPRSPSVSSKITQTSGSSGKTCTGSIPPLLKGHTPFLSATLRLYDDLCSPPGTSYDVTSAFGGKCNEAREDFGITIEPPRKSKSRHNLDDDKRQAIMQWIEGCDVIPSPESDERLDENEREQMTRECVILSHPLEDIIEIDEESMKESLRSKGDSHPLRILSKEGLNKVDGSERTAQDSDEDALERAMEASVSSMRSHDILAKLQSADMAPKDITVSLTTGTPSEMDLYRRASQLEEYAMERVKELEEEKLRKKKHKLVLNCCQNSMLSSGSTVVDWSTIEKRRLIEKEKEEEEQKKCELRARRDRLKAEEGELRKERQLIDKALDRPSLPTVLARQITQQFHSLNIGGKNSGKLRAPSDSLPSTPTISHRKLVAPCRTPSLTNCSSMVFPAVTTSSSHSKIPRRDTSHPRKTSKSRSEKKDRKSSLEKDEIIRSPYSKVTDPRVSAGACSSGRGSEEGESERMRESERQRQKKRQSYSASSGYESGAGDYHTYCKDPRLERLRHVDKRLTLGREAENLRETQRRLRSDLQMAKGRIGQVDDARSICHDSKSCGMSQATLVDTLTQENRILEKRLIACQNHTMLVTSFL